MKKQDKLPSFPWTEDIQSEVLEKNIYHYFSALESMLGLRCIRAGYYRGVLATGKWDGCFDYDRGMVSVTIRAYTYLQTQYKVQFYVGNVDDGEWEAYRDMDSLEDAVAIVSAIARLFSSKWSCKMPDTAVELNEWLVSNFKMYGVGMYG